MNKEVERAFRLLDALSHADAADAVVDEKKASEDIALFRLRVDEITGRLEAHVAREIAKAKRARLDHARAERLAKAAAPTASIELGRQGLLEKLGELLFAFPQLQASHRDFESMSDDDLRSLLADFKRLVETDEY